MEAQHIEKAVSESLTNLDTGNKSFVIYGEPQSGKTEMMIALTAKLLDDGHKIIIILLNDNIQLLSQNLDRFRRSDVDPTPVDISEILEEKIGDKRWIIFCKKNNNDLKKLINKLGNKRGKIVIDDEADYASPNAKVNKVERTVINRSIYTLLGLDGVYIGVTATPARLDMNNTFDNMTENWVYFGTHKDYVGKDTFFPLDLSRQLDYSLRLLPSTGDEPKHLQTALLSFFVNVSYINIFEDNLKKQLKFDSDENANFSFLIHTSGKTADHRRDEEIVNKIIDILSDEEHKQYPKLVESMYNIAMRRYGSDKADDIIKFVLRNIRRKVTAVLNTEIKAKRKIAIDPTNPPALFSIIIGGNIISRGVTFNNLLGMFFTRDVKHKMQQDTYIQRARMFGNRQNYLRVFELWIPPQLYLDWHKCFIYHYLSLEAIKTEKIAPVWIADDRVRPVSPSSIDRRTVVTDTGEMYFSKFQYTDEVGDIISNPNDEIKKLESINKLLGEDKFPSYFINFIKSEIKPFIGYVAIHDLRKVRKDTDYHDSLYRKQGVFGGRDFARFPQAIHHVMVLVNTYNEARIVYRYVSKAPMQFMRNVGKT